MSGEHYYETKKYRCLVEHAPRQSSSLYLIMCGIEYWDKRFGPVTRPGYHLHVILSGEGVLKTQGKSRRLHGGQMFIEKPGEMTTYYAAEKQPWTYCWVTFDGENAKEYAEQAGFGEGVNHRNSYIDPREFCKLADKMLSKPQLNLSGNLWRIGLLHQFLSLAIESSAYAHARLGAKSEVEHNRQTYIDHAIDFIKNNYSAISVADIASYLNIDRSYFTNLFRATVGCSPSDYLLTVRMEKSAQLLLNTSLPVQEVAEYVGYENPMTFSKMFKKTFGVSPRTYRAQPEGERAASQLTTQEDQENGEAPTV